MAVNRRIYPDDLAERFKGSDEKYRPANGTEGGLFMVLWCENCEKDRYADADDGCPIIVNTMAFNVDDPEYPAEWCFDENGQPQCTAFEARAKEE